MTGGVEPMSHGGISHAIRSTNLWDCQRIVSWLGGLASGSTDDASKAQIQAIADGILDGRAR